MIEPQLLIYEVFIIMEIWKKIKVFENYEISSLGNVKSNLSGKILKPGKMPNGYERVCITNGIK